MSMEGGYDNKHPRGQQANLKGWGARAVAAHQNSFESFVGFAAAMLTGIFTQQEVETLSLIGIIFICSRVVYHILYLANLDKLRSLVWGVGFVCICSLFVISL